MSLSFTTSKRCYRKRVVIRFFQLGLSLALCVFAACNDPIAHKNSTPTPKVTLSALANSAAIIPPKKQALPTGLQRIERRWVDLGPPPARCPPPQACSNGSIVLHRSCMLSGHDDGRPFRTTVNGQLCQELFRTAEHTILPHIRSLDPCTRSAHHGGAQLRIEINFPNGEGHQEKWANIDGCRGKEPWEAFLNKLLALHP
jgi:hypothetical protein